MARRETIVTREVTYTVVFDPDEDGGFVVTCPALPGLVTHGDTMEQARAMAAEAIQGDLESLRKDGLPFPAGEEHPKQARREAVTVRLPAA